MTHNATPMMTAMTIQPVVDMMCSSVVKDFARTATPARTGASHYPIIVICRSRIACNLSRRGSERFILPDDPVAPAPRFAPAIGIAVPACGALGDDALR